MMKKALNLFLLLTTVLCFNNSYAQSEAVKPSSNIGFKRLYIGVSTMQGVGYRLLLKNPNVPAADGLEFVREDILYQRNKVEKPNYATNVGIRVGINITRNIAFETGVEYAFLSYKWKKDYVFDSWNGSSVDEYHGIMKAQECYHYLAIPLSVNASIGKSKMRLAINAGTYINVLLLQQSKSQASFEDGTPTKYSANNTADFVPVNLTPFLGIGVDYQINSQMSLRIMPMAQFQALHNVKSTPLTEHLYSGGINMALNFGILPKGK